MVDLSVSVGSLTLKNPVMPASGCFSHEFGKVFDLGRLGALVTKSVSPKLRKGNAIPRVSEVAHGMLNSIGIPSKGIADYVEEVVPLFRGYGAPLVASISADTVEEFGSAAAAISVPGVAAIEANISCPNLEAHGHAFAMRSDSTRAAVAEIKKRTKLPVWAEAHTQHRRHQTHCEGGRGGGRRRNRGGQHHSRHVDQRQQFSSDAWKRHGRTLRRCDQTHRVAAGLSMRRGGEDSDHRLWRNLERR